MASQMVVPFGFGIGDFFELGKAGLAFYHRLRDCQDEYSQLAGDAKQLSDLLQSFNEFIKKIKLSHVQHAQVLEREKASTDFLNELNAVLDSYAVLGKDSTKLIHKLGWQKETVDDLRARLTAHVVMLQAFYHNLSQAAVLDALEILTLKIKAGSSKCPSAAAVSQGSLDEDDALNSDWQNITQDLEQLGITAKLATAHKGIILKYFERAIAAGELPFALNSGSSSSRSPSHTSVVGVLHAWLDMQAQFPSLQDIGYARSVPRSLNTPFRSEELQGLEHDLSNRETTNGVNANHNDPHAKLHAVPGPYWTSPARRPGNDGKLQAFLFPKARESAFVHQSHYSDYWNPNQATTTTHWFNSFQQLTDIGLMLRKKQSRPSTPDLENGRCKELCYTPSVVQSLFRQISRNKWNASTIFHLDAMTRIKWLSDSVIVVTIPALFVCPLLFMHSKSTAGVPLGAIGVLLMFTLLFAASISTFASARRHEILSTSAAYCAVLVVFLGGVGQSPQL